VSKTAKYYVYSNYENGIGELVFRAYRKEDVRKYLNVSKYDIGRNCYEESQINIKCIYVDFKIIDLTNGGGSQ